MKLREELTYRKLAAAGTSEGAKKAWDTRGRKGDAERLPAKGMHQVYRDSVSSYHWHPLSGTYQRITEGGIRMSKFDLTPPQMKQMHEQGEATATNETSKRMPGPGGTPPGDMAQVFKGNSKDQTYEWHPGEFKYISHYGDGTTGVKLDPRDMSVVHRSGGATVTRDTSRHMKEA